MYIQNQPTIAFTQFYVYEQFLHVNFTLSRQVGKVGKVGKVGRVGKVGKVGKEGKEGRLREQQLPILYQILQQSNKNGEKNK